MLVQINEENRVIVFNQFIDIQHDFEGMLYVPDEKFIYPEFIDGFDIDIYYYPDIQEFRFEYVPVVNIDNEELKMLRGIISRLENEQISRR